MVTANPVTVKAGAFTATYLAPGTAQSITVAATSSGAAPAATGTFAVTTSVVTPPTGEGSFTGTIAASGVSLVIFDGGTVEDLAAAATEAGLVSVSLTVDGSFVVYIPGAPAFVNAAFNAAFADGIAANTPVIVKK
jgi:hypothetical protein